MRFSAGTSGQVLTTQGGSDLPLWRNLETPAQAGSGGTGGGMSLIQKGELVTDTCLYDAVEMVFTQTNGSDCCWASGEP